MKKAFLLLLASICLTSGIFAQTIYTSKTDVFAAKSFNFYGYDFTRLKIADEKRFGQDLNKFFPAITELLLRGFNQKKFEVMFRKGKGNVPFNPYPTETVNSKIHHGKVIVTAFQKIPADTIPIIISRYQLPEKEGIGSVILFECFDKEKKTITAYMVFFDIATRNILYSNYIASKDGNGYNYMGDWKKASLKAIPRLLDLCTEDFAAYSKAQVKANKEKAEAEKKKSEMNNTDQK